MFKKNAIQYFVLCFIFMMCMTVSAFATASSGGGGGGNSRSSGGGGGSGRASERSAGGGSDHSSVSSGSSDDNGGLSDEAFENNGWTVVCRSNKCILLCGDDGGYIVYRYNGEYADHEYLNWYVENIWDDSEDFDYNKFLAYVNNNKNFVNDDYDDDDDCDDYDDYDNNYFNNNVYNAGSSDNNVNVYETYGKVLASNSSQWVKNQNGTYSLFYVDTISNQPAMATNGFFTIVDNTNGLNINTYYFDSKGIMVTTPFVTQSGQTINFTSTGEVIR